MGSDRSIPLDDSRKNAKASSRPGAVHVKVVAYVSLLMGVFLLLAGLFAFGHGNPRGGLITLFMCIFGVGSVMVFVGLKDFKTWARTLAIALAIVMIASPVLPFSCYTLWVLFWSPARDLFR